MSPVFAGDKIRRKCSLTFPVLEADLSTEVIFSLLTEIALAAGDDRFDNDAIPSLRRETSFPILKNFSRQFMTYGHRKRSRRMLSLEDVRSLPQMEEAFTPIRTSFGESSEASFPENSTFPGALTMAIG